MCDPVRQGPSFKALEVSLPCRHVVCIVWGGGACQAPPRASRPRVKGITLQRLLLLSPSGRAGCRPRGSEGCLSPGLILLLLVYPEEPGSSEQAWGREGSSGGEGLAPLGGALLIHFTCISRPVVQGSLPFTGGACSAWFKLRAPPPPLA